MSDEPWICVVDDDPDIREIVTIALEDRGYRVVARANGAEALAILRERPGCELVVLDLMMPGMSGWEFRALQESDPAIADVPVLVVSGARGLPEHARQLGVAAFLQKPVALDRLLEEIEHHRSSVSGQRNRRGGPTSRRRPVV